MNTELPWPWPWATGEWPTTGKWPRLPSSPDEWPPIVVVVTDWTRARLPDGRSRFIGAWYQAVLPLEDGSFWAACGPTPEDATAACEERVVRALMVDPDLATTYPRETAAAVVSLPPGTRRPRRSTRRRGAA